MRSASGCDLTQSVDPPSRAKLCRNQITLRYSLRFGTQVTGQLTTGCRGAGCSAGEFETCVLESLQALAEADVFPEFGETFCIEV